MHNLRGIILIGRINLVVVLADALSQKVVAVLGMCARFEDAPVSRVLKLLNSV